MTKTVSPGTEPQFTATPEEREKIAKIALRASAWAKKLGVDHTTQDFKMDIEAAHCTGCPLDLDKLAGFDNSNFCHDVFGIRRYLNRRTGELASFFVPRCALPEKSNRKAA